MAENGADFLDLPKDKFRSSANKLLNECFLLRKHKDTASDYYYILNNRSAFESFFDLIGYELIFREDLGVIALYNSAGTGRIQLKKAESILLLILRLLYIEKRKELSASDDVIIVADEIYDKYNLLNLRAKLDKTTMRNALGLFRRYHLLNNLDADMSNPDTRMVIQPSILFSMTSESLEEFYRESKEKLSKYENGGDPDGGASDEEADENSIS